MKKLLTGLFLLAAIGAQAQTNLQVHYDFGENRNYVTTTLEMFKPDKCGNTFFFVDFDYNQGQDNHPGSAYMEIARCLKFWDGPFSAHVEYNGGLLSFAPINNSYLVGVDYAWATPDFSKTLNLKVLYKNIQGKNSTPQFTGVWGVQLLDKKVTFSGFADLWWEKNVFFADSKTYSIFIAEPQIWYNFTDQLSAGGEVELASNFGGVKGFKACPTLGVKWNF